MTDIKLALSNVKEPTFTKPEMVEKVQNLPEHIEPFASQVAGHEHAVFYDKTNGNILKPIFDIRGIREEIFYRLLFDSRHDNDPALTKLRSFMPTYISTQRINDVDFVTLNDLIADFEHPSLMDVKIGYTTYDRDATEEKIANESTKNQLNRALGFRVLAIKKWNYKKNVYEEKDRDACRKCSVEDEEKFVRFFLEQSSKKKTKEIVDSVVQQLNQIGEWFKEVNVDLFEFIGTSVFFIYSYTGGKLDCRLKLIDFAHMYPLAGSKVNTQPDKKDHNFLTGLDSLTNVIRKITKK